MKIVKKGQAGTMQSSDLMVIVEPAPELTIEIESTVKKQFEHLIRAKLEESPEYEAALARARQQGQGRAGLSAGPGCLAAIAIGSIASALHFDHSTHPSSGRASARPTSSAWL